MAGSTLFISYRRAGGAGHAGRLFDVLAQHLGRRRVFMDATGIAPGASFVESLRNALKSCGAMVVVVMPGWSEARDATGLRLHQPDDWVRTEIETALAMGVRVVPALVGGARMPAPSELPESLRAFAQCQAVDLRDASWDDDVRRLFKALDLEPRSAWPWRPLAVILAIAVVAVLAGIAWQGSIDPGTPSNALASLTPSDEEQQRIVAAYPGRDLNVPLLRHFLANAARRGVPRSALQGELDVFVKIHQDLQRGNLIDDAGFNLNDKAAPRPDCEEAEASLRDGDIAAAKAAFVAGASWGRRATSPAMPRRGIYAAWCGWRLGRTEEMDADLAAAAAAYDAAIDDAARAGKQSERVGYKILRDAARLAKRTGPPALAIQRYEAAIPQAVAGGAYFQTELMMELAAFQEARGDSATAMVWRERAQKIFDAEHDPGDARARDNGRILARAWEAAGRQADARALRDRYGLAGAK